MKYWRLWFDDPVELLEKSSGYQFNCMQKAIINSELVNGLVIVGRSGRGVSTALVSFGISICWRYYGSDVVMFNKKAEDVERVNGKRFGMTFKDDKFLFNNKSQIRFGSEYDTNSILIIDNADELDRFEDLLMQCGKWVVGGEYKPRETDPRLLRMYAGCDRQIEVTGNCVRVLHDYKNPRTIGIKSLI